MIQVTLKGGVVKEYEAGISAADVAKDISMGLYRAACACKIDGKVCDLRTPLDQDCELSILTFDDPDGMETFRHTSAHILAQAVKRLYPNTKFAIGPAVDAGFYYDMEVEHPFTPDELVKIEAEMKKIVKEGLEIKRFELPPEEAKKLMAERGETYKLELIEEHAGNGEHISFYQQGEYIDLCAGPHLMSVSPVKAFKLTQCTGAYWRGDATKQQLCRVYGISFPKASMLEEHLTEKGDVAILGALVHALELKVGGDDPMTAVKRRLDHMAANVTGRAGDKDRFHGISSLWDGRRTGSH